MSCKYSFEVSSMESLTHDQPGTIYTLKRFIPPYP